MPATFGPADLTTARQAGVTHTVLANRALLGTDALQVEQIALEPGARTRPAQVSTSEHFVYVIRGAGQARVGHDTFPLESESVLWLEPGEVYTLEADAAALEILVCRAPAPA